MEEDEHGERAPPGDNHDPLQPDQHPAHAGWRGRRLDEHRDIERAPFGITWYYTDGWGTYERHVAAATHTVGKEHLPRIESKPSNLRTRIKRLVRRTSCFSKTEWMHDLVLGLFANRYEFGRAI